MEAELTEMDSKADHIAVTEDANIDEATFSSSFGPVSMTP